MRIGIVTSWLERGAAYLSRSFMNGLQRLGHDVFIFARGGEEYDFGPDWNLGNVHYSSSRMGTCPRCPYTGIADLDEFRSWLDSNQIRIVLFNEQLDPAPMAECKGKGVRTVFFGLGYVLPMAFYCSHFDLIICHTKLTHRIFAGTGIAQFVPWGVDCELFSPQGRNLTSDSVVYFHNAGMSFGNLRKGTHRLVRAWGGLSRREKRETKLIIHSQLPIDVLRHNAPEVGEIVGREANIEFFVGVSRPPAGYHLANVYVYPASVDSLGLTITEAMACGMPVIVTAGQPFDEFVRHDVNGLLVRSRRRSWSNTLGHAREWKYYDVTIADLTEKLRYFITNKDQILKMGGKSREIVEASFDFRRNFPQVDALLQSL